MNEKRVGIICFFTINFSPSHSPLIAANFSRWIKPTAFSFKSTHAPRITDLIEVEKLPKATVPEAATLPFSSFTSHETEVCLTTSFPKEEKTFQPQERRRSNAAYTLSPGQ